MKPVAVRRVEGRLHGERRPAIEFADGFGVWALGGHRVERRHVLEPSSITIADVHGAADPELRRLLRERGGESRFAPDGRSVLVHVDRTRVRPGESPTRRILLDTAGGSRTLVGFDERGARVYEVPVPRTCTTCPEALATVTDRLADEPVRMDGI
jgi:hypothetical protein